MLLPGGVRGGCAEFRLLISAAAAVARPDVGHTRRPLLLGSVKFESLVGVWQREGFYTYGGVLAPVGVLKKRGVCRGSSSSPSFRWQVPKTWNVIRGPTLVASQFRTLSGGALGTMPGEPGRDLRPLLPVISSSSPHGRFVAVELGCSAAAPSQQNSAV
ncbi:hypothetical protein B0T24DRAFT_362835 [Lasiosphaeria ovina]|uniref:Uncharacterized protein n=1 Tax=Lasiosphaeria ovina TaxID=92902 RepID=A0AAE0K577_9PEZI|nr:hypothetical protein B0T24DRAFT_362835 [Lasiosphaeria ovina]